MNIKISQFIPLVGTMGGFALLTLTGFEDIKFTLDPSHIWAFMSITIGSAVVHKASKLKWKPS